MKELFEKLLNDLSAKSVLSEDRKEELSILFEQKLKEYKEKIMEDALEAIDEDHSKKLEQVIEAIDEDHTEKLEQVLESIDEDHTEKLEQVIEAIDEDHTEKLRMVIEKYENGLLEEVTAKVSDFLDVYLEDTLPEDTVVDKVKLEQLEDIVENIRKAVVLSDIAMNEELKEAFLDGKQMLEDKEKEINQLMLEKIEISKKIKKMEADALLEDKCKNLSPKLVAYLETRFKDSDKEEIEEQFVEAVKAFNEDEQLIREELQQQVQSSVNPKRVMTEGVVDDKTGGNPLMESYINRFKNSYKYVSK